MIWTWDDQQAMRRIFGQVWQSMAIMRPWPTHHMAPPGHGSHALGVRYRRPTIRSHL